MIQNVKYPVIDMVATGRRINEMRIAHNQSVEELSNYMNFKYPQAVYKWLRGECLPTVDNLLALSVLWDVSMNDLICILR